MENIEWVKMCRAYLTIKNKHLDRNFTFTIEKKIDHPIITLNLTIQKSYAQIIKLDPKQHDACFISIQNNDEDKILIFNGTINRVFHQKNFIEISAIYSCVDNRKFEETFIDCDAKRILKSFLPKLIFEGRVSSTESSSVETSHAKIILKNGKAESLAKMMKLCKTHYFIDRLKNVVVMDRKNRKNAPVYHINNCVQHVSIPSITIFPIPMLELGEIVSYEDTLYAVTQIKYQYKTHYRMILGVEPCQP